MGETKLYQRLLSKFRDNQDDFTGQFADVRENSYPNAAMRVVHTLKDTSCITTVLQ